MSHRLDEGDILSPDLDSADRMSARHSVQHERAPICPPPTARSAAVWEKAAPGDLFHASSAIHLTGGIRVHQPLALVIRHQADLDISCLQPAAEMPDQSGFPRTKKATHQEHPADGARARVANISEHHGKILVISHASGQYADTNKNEHPMITDSSTSSGLTRRSFIKRSVVAAVAVSSMTIFSGLVRANIPRYYPKIDCKLKKWNGWFGDGAVFPQNQEVAVKFCRVDKPKCGDTINCGKFFKRDANGRVELGDNGQPLTEKVSWRCDEMEDNPFFGPDFPDQPRKVPVTKMCLP